MELRVPSHAVKNQSVKLECHFDLDGETLYSVKWYKDANEFYRYVPRDDPPAQVFTLPGVTVDVSADKFIKRGGVFAWNNYNRAPAKTDSKQKKGQIVAG